MKFLVIFLTLAVAGSMAAPLDEQKAEEIKTVEAPVENGREGKFYRTNTFKSFETKSKVPVTRFEQVKSTYVQPSQVPTKVLPAVTGTEQVDFIPIIKSSADLGIENFNYNYETANGIAVEASGEVKKFENDKYGVVMRGSYQYINSDGEPVLVTYVADENGFQPQSDVIPVAPPVPEEIARSLEYIKAHPYVEKEEKH